MMKPYLQTIKDKLELRGFFVEEGYEYTASTNKEGKNPRKFTVDLAAFLDSKCRDMSTIAVIALSFPKFPVGNPFANSNRHLAPNVQLVVTPDYIQWWTPRENRALHVTSTSTVESDFSRFHITPEELWKARQGFQSSFFSLLPDALDYARDANSKLVTRCFNDAMKAVARRNGLAKLTAIGLDLLAAIILDDKRAEIGRYTETNNAQDAAEALRRAQKYFPLSFKDIPIISDEILNTLWMYLRTDMSYRGMTPDDLSDLLSSLYEGVLLSKPQKRIQGSYYTPRSLARRVLEHMPIEEIAPQDRVVLDGTCGSGNLLRAAGARLKSLLPANTTDEEYADYLSRQLVGIDKDPFAANIARKALLLGNLPYDRYWIVEATDFLKAELSAQPSIIIANPPFRGVKGRGGGELAVEFLTHYLEILRPGGLVGIFLPAPLLQNPGDAQLRLGILESCSILEIWMLPENSIPGSSLGIAVLILKKHDGKTNNVNEITRVYVAHNMEDKKGFANNQFVSSAFISRTADLYAFDARLVPSSLNRLWTRVRSQFSSMKDLGFNVVNGVQGTSDNFSAVKKDGWRKSLSYTTGFETFYIDWERQTDQKYVNYPGTLRRPRKAEHFRAPKKVVVQGERNPKNPWRLIAAVDDNQLVIKESFHYILPIIDGPSLEVIAAVLNSSFANAWYSERDLQFHVQNWLVEQIPFPNFSEQQEQRLKSIVSDIAAIKQSLPQNRPQDYSREFQKIRDLILEMDEIVFAAYGVTKGERRYIDRLMSRDRRPGVEWEKVVLESHEQISLQPEGPVYRANCDVINVDVENAAMIVDMRGLSRIPLRFPIPPAVPGWALRDGVAFSADIPISQADNILAQLDLQGSLELLELDRVDLFNLTLSRSSYLDDEQLLLHYATARQ